MNFRTQSEYFLRVCAAAAEKKYSLSSSEDEFDDWTKSSKQKRAAVIDDDSFIPEPSGAPDSDMDSPPPAPVV